MSLLNIADIDATKGPILKNLIIYTIPIAIGSIIQTFFNAADMIVLGNFASSLAVASVGATANIVSLLVNTFIGLAGGTQVTLAHAYGEHNKKKINDIVGTSLIIAVVLGAIITIIGLICTRWFLDMTNCPQDCYEGAVLYLQIYLLSVPAIMIYNYGSAIIRVSGDTQRPLYYMIASGLLNVVLNFLLCIILTEKIAAVAIATLVSQILGAALVLIHLVNAKNDCKIDLKHLAFNGEALKKILTIGIPCALSSSLYSISNLQIQSAINSYGSSATAANSAAANIEGWVGAFTNSVGTSCLTFIGQNIGARKPDRIKTTFRISLILNFTIGLVLGLGFYAIGDKLLALYVSDDLLAIEYGMIRMKFILAIYCIAGLNNILSTVIQAFGYSLLTMTNSVVSVLLLRIVWMFFIYPLDETLVCLYFCYSVSWLLCLTINIIMTLLIYPKKLKALKGDTPSPQPCEEVLQ